MLRSSYVIAALLSLSHLFLFAQTGSISGKIIDTKIADVVIGATIKLDDGGLGASSDLDGQFSIQKVPVGTHKITITYLGYTTKTISDIFVKEGQASVVDVAMKNPPVLPLPKSSLWRPPSARV